MLQQFKSQFLLPVPPSTCFNNVCHDHCRYKTINGNYFSHNGHKYSVNSRSGSCIRLDILQPIVDELEAMLRLYSRVFLTRFDLHFPELTSIETGNKWMRQLFKKLRVCLESKNNRPSGLSEPIINFAYGWVREQENAGQIQLTSPLIRSAALYCSA